MKKLLVVLFVLVLLTQGCGPKNLSTIKYLNLESVDTDKENYKLKNEEAKDIQELFEFECEENPFIFNALSDVKNDLTLQDVSKGCVQSIGNRYNDSIKYGFETIYFDFDSKEIKTNQKEKLQKNINIINNMTSKEFDIVVEGHSCDFDGSEEYNLILSEDRAKVVVDRILESCNINKDSISSVGRGCEMKIVPFGNKQQQSPNRRVEVFLYLKNNKKD